MSKSIGALEFISISKGIFVADTILKKAEVEIVYFKTICPGKFIIIISGDEEEVDTAIDYGDEIAGTNLVGSFKVHAVSPEIISGLKNRYEKPVSIDALGIVETRKVCTGIKALDKALKSAAVSLCKVYLAFAIGGKLVFIITGSVSSVEYSLSQCKDILSDSEYENAAIIASPNEEMLESLLHYR